MSFLGDATKAVMVESGITKFEKVKYGVIIPKYFCDDVPRLEDFLSPEPDVIGEEGHPRISAGPDGEMETSLKLILGSYRMMQSLGVISLYTKHQGLFYKALLCKIVPQFQPMSKFDLEAGAQLVAVKTYYHEQFHFACDVMHHLFCSEDKFDVLLEEALAVAWAWLHIMEERYYGDTKISQMNDVFFKQLMDHSFRYRSPGYKNWRKYKNEMKFRKALEDYVLPANLHQPIANGFTLDEITYALAKSITIKGKVVEKIEPQNTGLPVTPAGVYKPRLLDDDPMDI